METPGTRGSPALQSHLHTSCFCKKPRIADEEQCRRAEDTAKRRGWQGTVSAANRTDKGGASAGVGSLAKKHIEICEDPTLIAKRFRPRIAHDWVCSGRMGGLRVLSLYLCTAEGLTQRNQDIIDEVERLTKLLNGSGS